MTVVRRHAEAIAFWTLALLHLVPVWTFRYLPTQDGPSHVNNAQIIKDFHVPESGYDRIFEIRVDPLPNLTSHLLLAGFMYVLPPLFAEKLLVTLYVLGFAGSFRYFLGAFGPDHRPLSWAGLLFVFSRCFWMGFYNYCLSLVLLWFILGYVLRRLTTLHPAQAVVLLLLFTAAYFTHLAGFLVAVTGAPLAALLSPPRRLATVGLILLAALPSACLTMNYLEQTGFRHAPAAMRVVHDPLNRLSGGLREPEMADDLALLDAQVFGFHAGAKAIMGSILGVYLLILTMLTIAIPPSLSKDAAAGPGPLFPGIFGVLLLAAYLLVPDHLGGGDHGLPNGGFLKARLAPLPPLLWLACVREPRAAVLRIASRLGTAVMLGANLWLVTTAVRDGNRELARHTAGLEAVGRGHRLYCVDSAGWPSPFANPLRHVVDYYCLGTGNVNLDNYEAVMPHFPIKYRPDFNRGRGIWPRPGDNDQADVLICWQADGARPPGWVEVFHEGSLRIFKRPGS